MLSCNIAALHDGTNGISSNGILLVLNTPLDGGYRLFVVFILDSGCVISLVDDCNCLVDREGLVAGQLLGRWLKRFIKVS